MISTEPPKLSTEPKPHELLNQVMAYELGRRTALFGPLMDDLFGPMFRALADDLSIYCKLRPYNQLRGSAVRLREGAERAYVLTDIRDQGAPLRLIGIMSHWDEDIETNQPGDWVRKVNGRRWHFLDHTLGAFLLPLLNRVADVMVEYYQRRPYAVPKAGIIRWLEGVDATTLCVEIDDRSTPTPKDWRNRYLVQ